MRASWIAALPLVAALALAPRPGSAQASVTLQFGRPTVVTNYAPEVYGDWTTSYIRWQPVTLYYFDGHYYSRPVPRGRVVQVYRSGTAYFLPPRDRGWDNKDKLYNYSHRPTEDDYVRVVVPRGKAKGHYKRP